MAKVKAEKVAKVKAEKTKAEKGPIQVQPSYRKVYNEASTKLVMLKGRRFHPAGGDTQFAEAGRLFVSFPGNDPSASEVFVKASETSTDEEKWSLFTEEARAAAKRPRKARAKAVAVDEIVSVEDVPAEASESTGE